MWIWTWECKQRNIDILRFLIEEYPNIPYTYAALAECLKKQENDAWRVEAEKSKNILEIMKQIHPHPIEVDRFYDFVNRILK